MTTELATADDPSGSASSPSSSESDPEEAERNEALGLGGAKLKAVLKDINKDVNESSGIAVKGGEVLSIIHERMQTMSGDPSASKLYGTLLRSAGKPYVDMVGVWIRTGRLVDPYEELCVKESKFIDRGTLEMDYTDEYWERRYTVFNLLSHSDIMFFFADNKVAQRWFHSWLVEATTGGCSLTQNSWW